MIHAYTFRVEYWSKMKLSIETLKSHTKPHRLSFGQSFFFKERWFVFTNHS